MDSRRWHRIEALFSAAVEVPAEARESLLRDACGDDLALRREVESLLAAHANVGEAFLEDLDEESIARLVDLRPTQPQRIGPWRVIGEIGRGGMGVVYDARRDDGQFEQTAAVKLIQSAVASEEMLRRFLRERQILARMQHPGIARLLGGGVTPEGRPWFALERVEGVPLTRYCDEQRLGVESRLRLFKAICEAVEYAHQSLVIHRDLKPSNVLVDPQGQVKLLDFGIAKLLREEGSEQAAQTAIEGRVMTPGYGAPEQWLGAAVTTATDVFALGVILYELLAGQRPYSSNRTAFARQMMALADSEPPRLSSLAAGSDRRPGRGTSRQRRHLDSDLDAIAAKAVRGEPQQRYASAEALREDVERYLRREPVRACSDSLAYRAKKFLHRHRAGVAAVALVVAALLIGLSIALWQAGVAARQRDVAREESEQTEQVKNFIVDLFRASDPRQEQGVELTAKQLLERGLERVRSDLDQRPDLRIELLTAIGEVSTSLGDHEGAKGLFAEALEIDIGSSPRDQLRIATALNGFGEASAHLGDDRMAEATHRRALAIRLQHAGDGSLETAQTYNNLGVALARQRKLDEAIEHYRRALDIRRSAEDTDGISRLETLGNLATAYRLQGELAVASDVFQQVIDGMRQRGFHRHPYMATYLSERAAVERRLGNYIDAETLLRQSLELSREFWGESHPDTRISMNNYAMIAHALGNDLEAEALMRRVVEYDVEQYGPQHTFVAIGRGNLARVLLELGEVEQATAQFEAAATIHSSESSQWALAIHHVRHAWAHLATGMPRQALRLTDRALAIERRRSPPSDERLAGALTAAAFASSALELWPQAEAHFREALARLARRSTTRHPDAALALFGLAELRLAQGRLREARPYLERASAIWAAALPDGHWRLATLQVALGECEIRQGNLEEGRRLLEQGIARLRRDRGATHWRTLAAIARRDAVAGQGSDAG